MTDEAAIVRDESKDDLFKRLRLQDEQIAAIRKDIEFIVAISQNLEGFSNFCAKWGRRINTVMKWLARVAIPVATLYEIIRHPISSVIANWFKTKGAP